MVAEGSRTNFPSAPASSRDCRLFPIWRSLARRAARPASRAPTGVRGSSSMSPDTTPTRTDSAERSHEVLSHAVPGGTSFDKYPVRLVSTLGSWLLQRCACPLVGTYCCPERTVFRVFRVTRFAVLTISKAMLHAARSAEGIPPRRQVARRHDSRHEGARRAGLEEGAVQRDEVPGPGRRGAARCYTAMLQKLRTEVGTNTTQVWVAATTVVRPAPYVSGATLTGMVAQQKAHVRRLQSANPN